MRKIKIIRFCGRHKFPNKIEKQNPIPRAD